jgi:hypothetical protein
MIKIFEKFDAVQSLVGGELSQPLDGVIRYHSGQTPPSDSEIDAEVKRLQAEYDALQYQRDRQYPNLGEQLDMLFHDMTAGKGTKDGEWYKAIAKVKSDNPKPE